MKCEFNFLGRNREKRKETIIFPPLFLVSHNFLFRSMALQTYTFALISMLYCNNKRENERYVIAIMLSTHNSLIFMLPHTTTNKWCMSESENLYSVPMSLLRSWHIRRFIILWSTSHTHTQTYIFEVRTEERCVWDSSFSSYYCSQWHTRSTLYCLP